MKRVLLVALVACGGSPPSRPLAVTATVTLPEPDARAVVELGDQLYVLGDHRVAIYRAGIKLAETAPTPAWRSASTIAAPDGEGRWVVATTDTGELWRITVAGDVEPVGDRLGVGAVAQILGAGATTAAALEGGIAVSTDGVHVRRFAQAELAAVAKDRLARLVPGGVELWDLARGTSVRYAVPTPTRVAFVDADTATPRLVIAADRALYLERRGGLARLAATAPVADVAVAGARVWVLAGGALWVVDGDRLVRTTGTPGDHATLTASTTGDVWIRDRSLSRFSLTADAGRAWPGPVFQRVCAHCHLPGGSADLDLSTPGAWASHSREIIDRVLQSRTMPPAGTAFSDEERAAVTRWAQGLSK